MGMYCVHDLVRLADSDGGMSAREPAWLQGELRRWAVVRRVVEGEPGRLAVGFRGLAREQRYADVRPVTMVERHVRPWELVAGLGERCSTHSAAAVRALPEMAAVMQGMVWGPGGSVGFELATGIAVVQPESDLDVIVEMQAMPSRVWASEMLVRMRRVFAAVDVMVEVPDGGFSLADYAENSSFVLRASEGPQIRERAVSSSYVR